MANNTITSTDGPVNLEPFDDEEIDWIMGDDDSATDDENQ